MNAHVQRWTNDEGPDNRTWTHLDPGDRTTPITPAVGPVTHRARNQTFQTDGEHGVDRRPRSRGVDVSGVNK